jgi:hypothetical protein
MVRLKGLGNNSVASVRERQPLVGKASANFDGEKGVTWWIPTAVISFSLTGRRIKRKILCPYLDSNPRPYGLWRSASNPTSAYEQSRGL